MTYIQNSQHGIDMLFVVHQLLIDATEAAQRDNTNLQAVLSIISSVDYSTTNLFDVVIAHVNQIIHSLCREWRAVQGQIRDGCHCSPANS